MSRGLVVDKEMRERAVKALERSLEKNGKLAKFIEMDDQMRAQVARDLIDEADLVCTDDATISHLPPRRVFVSWCPGCGNVDYAYKMRSKKERPPDCPRCNMPSEDMVIVGPYILRKKKTT